MIILDKCALAENLALDGLMNEVVYPVEFMAEGLVFLAELRVLFLLEDLVTVLGALGDVQCLALELKVESLELLGELLLLQHHVAVVRVVSIVQAQVQELVRDVVHYLPALVLKCLHVEVYITKEWVNDILKCQKMIKIYNTLL